MLPRQASYLRMASCLAMMSPQASLRGRTRGCSDPRSGFASLVLGLDCQRRVPSKRNGPRWRSPRQSAVDQACRGNRATDRITERRENGEWALRSKTAGAVDAWAAIDSRQA